MSTRVLRLLPPAAVLSLFAWVEAPRFRLKTPSLVDDWFAISTSKRALHALLQGAYAASDADVPGRYRPAFAAVWNFAQWHLLGRPSMATADLWGAVRIAAFVVAIATVTRLLAGRRYSLAHPLVWLAPLVVVMTPGIAVDLVRFGPGEPLAIAGVVIGLALIASGVRRAVTVGTVLQIVVGYAIYAFGVYFKEISIFLLPLLPALFRIENLDIRRRRVGLALAALLIPPTHVLLRIGLFHAQGQNPYAHTPTHHLSWIDSALLPFAPSAVGTNLWTVVLPAILAAVVVLCTRGGTGRARVVAILATGWAMTAFELATGGGNPSRYYIPWLVAVAAVAVAALSQLSPRAQMIGATLLIVLFAPFGAANNVRAWASVEDSGASALGLARSVADAGCTAYLVGFDLERRVAIPKLLPYGRPPMRIPACAADHRPTYAVRWPALPLPTSVAVACVSRWQHVARIDSVDLYRCVSPTRVSPPGATSSSFPASGTARTGRARA